jgi:16S rRNA (uracil1498-N3)-methyltransferase
MADRYFVETPVQGRRVVLIGPEAHHLAHVMRVQPGDDAILFDGSGDEFAAVVRAVRRSEVELEVLERRTVDRELPIEVTLGVSLPKGDRQKWLVEKVVELGLARLVPLVTARSVAQPVAQALARLERGVIEASKQCGRNRLMQVLPPQDWTQFLAAAADARFRLIAHPGGTALRRLAAGGTSAPKSVCLAVGPEGGFTDAEVEQALAAGWQMVDLGPRILRVETAAVALTALIAAQSAR